MIDRERRDRSELADRLVARAYWEQCGMPSSKRFKPDGRKPGETIERFKSHASPYERELLGKLTVKDFDRRGAGLL